MFHHSTAAPGQAWGDGLGLLREQRRVIATELTGQDSIEHRPLSHGGAARPGAAGLGGELNTDAAANVSAESNGLSSHDK